MNSATTILREEHDAILQMLDAMEMAAHRIEAGQKLPAAMLQEFHDFFVSFADKRHHAKEEDLLFPLLEQKGLPRIGGPVGCMLHEHDEGRGWIRKMTEARDGCAAGQAKASMNWVRAARGYIGLLRQHIMKENEILFVMADRLMSPEEQAGLLNSFAQVEKTEIHSRSDEAQEKLSVSVASLSERERAHVTR